MKLLLLAGLSAILQASIPAGPAFLHNLQDRDTVLVGDRLQYGVELSGLDSVAGFAFPDFVSVSNDTLTLVSDWQTDSLDSKGRPIKAGSRKKGVKKPASIRASVVLSPFEQARYSLPDIPVLRVRTDGTLDTLVFSGQEIEVLLPGIDTSFTPHDLKEQVDYPVTFKEVAPYACASIGGAALVAAVVFLILALLKRRKSAEEHRDPAYIVALRGLERYRGKEHWAPEKQKEFYSGVTDILKVYIGDRFGVDAPEMTTAELFDAIKSEEVLTPELYGSLRDLFDRADFIKFAKHTADEEENASVLPLAIRFVTSTYEMPSEQPSDDAANKEEE